MSEVVNITKNGEIIYDPSDKMYKVNDETYSEYVCITPYKRLAFVANAEYARMLERIDDLNPSYMEGE